jgi:hypothetical protein
VRVKHVGVIFFSGRRNASTHVGDWKIGFWEGLRVTRLQDPHSHSLFDYVFGTTRTLPVRQAKWEMWYILSIVGGGDIPLFWLWDSRMLSFLSFLIESRFQWVSSKSDGWRLQVLESRIPAGFRCHLLTVPSNSSRIVRSESFGINLCGNSIRWDSASQDEAYLMACRMLTGLMALPARNVASSELAAKRKPIMNESIYPWSIRPSSSSPVESSKISSGESLKTALRPSLLTESTNSTG